eukprot:c20317_g1_i3 orf=183-1103(+)
MVQLEIENIKQTLAASHPGLWFRDHVRNWAGGVGHGERKRAVHLHSLHQPWIKTHEPLKRTLQFWKRSLRIYFDYKFCQLRVQFLKGKEEQDKAWEEQHESAAAKIYLLCTELGGFFLKAAQMVGKPDLAPDAWVRKLVMLCDAAPATPFSTVKLILEREGLPLHDFFEKFEGQPIGSASIAQVHRARVKGSTRDVAVKVQHPGVEELMMTDIRNLKAFAAFLQRFDIKFDLLSITDELEDQEVLLFHGNLTNNRQLLFPVLRQNISQPKWLCEALWLRRIFGDCGCHQDERTTIFCDSSKLYSNI